MRFVLLSAVAIVLSFHRSGLADDVGDKLEAAKAKWETATTEAADTLERAIDQTIDKLAANGDLDAIKVLREVKEAFAEKGQIPAAPLLAKEVRPYLVMRRMENGTLTQAYKDAIAAYTMAKVFDQAEAVDSELDDFLEAEAAHLGDQPPNQSPKAAKSLEIINDFASQFYDQLSEIADEPTSAKRDESHRAMMKGLDSEIRKKSLVLRFPIQNVEESSRESGAFDIEFGPPEGFENIDHVFGHLQSIYAVRLKKEQALDTKPGDIFEITGTGRFATGYVEVPRTIEVLTFKPQDLNSNTYKVYFQNYKFAIEQPK
jgi:hypothetical protein